MDRRSYTTCYCVLSFLNKNTNKVRFLYKISFNYLFVCLGFSFRSRIFFTHMEHYKGDLREPVTLTPIAERLAVEMSLSIFTIQVFRGFEYPTFRLRGGRSYPLRHRFGFHLIKNGYNCIIDFIIFTFFFYFKTLLVFEKTDNNV